MMEFLAALLIFFMFSVLTWEPSHCFRHPGLLRNAEGQGHKARASKLHILLPDSMREFEEPPRVFETHVDYPCEFLIKVVGKNQGEFVEDILAIVSRVCDTPTDEIKHSYRDTSSGRHRSISVYAPVETSNQLYYLYERISDDGRVLYKFWGENQQNIRLENPILWLEKVNRCQWQQEEWLDSSRPSPKTDSGDHHHWWWRSTTAFTF